MKYRERMEFMNGVEGWGRMVEQKDGVHEWSNKDEVQWPGMEYKDRVQEWSIWLDYRDEVQSYLQIDEGYSNK